MDGFGVRCRLVPCAVVLSLCEPVGPVPEVPLGQFPVLPDHDDVFTVAIGGGGGKIEASGDTTFNLQRKSESRFGVIANAGVDIKLNKSMGAVIGVKYALTNLIGKKTDITTTSTNTLTDDEETGSSSLREVGLNDEESTNNRAKSLVYIQFYAGISFYFGQVLK